MSGPRPCEGPGGLAANPRTVNALSGWPCILALALLTPALAAPSLLPGDGSFEADGAGFLLTVGQTGPVPYKAAIDPWRAADGRRSVRITAHAPTPEVEVQSSWVELPSGDVHLSAYVNSDRLGLQAVFTAIDAVGERTSVSFSPTADWRRYAATFTLAEPGWRCFAIGPAGGAPVHDPGSIWVDDLRLDPGQPTSSARPVLGAELVDPPGLRRAGDRPEFLLRLVSPEAAHDVMLRWRIEDPFGQVLDLGSRRIELEPGEPAEVRVRMERLRPGAYRLEATAEVAGQHLRADATVVAVSWELGGPEPWFGVSGAWGGRGLDALELMRIGIERGLVPPGPEDVSFGALAARRRAGITTVGFLPERADAEQVAARVERFRGLIKGWELPSLDPPLDVPEEAKRIDLAAAGIESGDPGSLGLLLRVPADEAGLSRLSSLLEVAEHPGDGIELALGDGEPETLAGHGLMALVREARVRIGDLPLEVGVVASGWAAEPWDADLTPAPLRAGDAVRLTALDQASRLVRSVILAKAGGADWYLYPGAPIADRPEALSMVAAGRTSDLYAADGQPLPAVAGLDHVLDVLRNRRFAEAIDLGDGLLCLRFHERRPLAILWRPGSSGTTDLRLPLPAAQLAVTDLFGQNVVVRGDAGAAFLAITRHPIYVEAAHLPSASFAAGLAAAELLATGD